MVINRTFKCVTITIFNLHVCSNFGWGQVSPPCKVLPKDNTATPSVTFTHADGETDLIADKVIYDLSAHKASANGNVRFTKNSNEVQVLLTAATVNATLDDQNKVSHLQAHDHVVIHHTKEGKLTKLMADQCDYDPTTQKAVCVGNVRLEQQGHLMVGARLDADIAKESYTMSAKNHEQIQMDIKANTKAKL